MSAAAASPAAASSPQRACGPKIGSHAPLVWGADRALKAPKQTNPEAEP